LFVGMVFYHISVMVALLLITDGFKASTSLNLLIEKSRSTRVNT